MKKIYIFIVILITVLVNSVSVASERDLRFETEVATILNSLGLFNGISDSDYDLDREASRVEAVVMIIRLMGKEKEALSKNYSHPFEDVPSWADKYIGYAYANNIVNGVSPTEFGNNSINCTTYLTYMLRALGYSDFCNTDFCWNDPYDLAIRINLLPSVVDRENFIRADMVCISYAALNTRTKTNGNFLCVNLINDGVIRQELFNVCYDFGLLNRKNDYINEIESEALEEPINIIPSNEIITNGNTQIENKPKEDYKPNLVDNGWSKEKITSFLKNMSEELEDTVIIIMGTDRYGNTSSGTGFFINYENFAITNYHVVKDCSTLAVAIIDGPQYCSAYVVSYDVENDLAIIYVDGADNYEVLKLEMQYNEYDYTFTCGFPKNELETSSDILIYKTTSGIIKEKSIIINGKSYIGVNNDTTHGNSGGPLMNSEYGVIGVVTMKDTIGNMIYAVPSEKIVNLVNRTNFDSFIKMLPKKYNISKGVLKEKYINSSIRNEVLFNLRFFEDEEFSILSTKGILREITEFKPTMLVNSAIGEYYNSNGMYYSSMRTIQEYSTGKVYIDISGYIEITQMALDGKGITIPYSIYNGNVLVDSGSINIYCKGETVGSFVRFSEKIYVPIVLSPSGNYEIRLGNKY